MNKTIGRQHVLVIFIITAILLLATVSLIFQPGNFIAIDLGSWGADWSKFDACIDQGQVPCQQLSQFPIAYLLNSGFLLYLSSLGMASHHGMLVINTLFVVLPSVFVLIIGSQRPAWPVALVYLTAVAATAVPPAYLYSGALEVQSGVMMGLFLSSWILLLRSHLSFRLRWAFAFFFIICGFLLAFYKDTNVPVICASLIGAYIQAWVLKRLGREDDSTKQPKIFHWSILFIVLGLALSVNMAYNGFRYDSLLPSTYMQVANATAPTPGKSLEFLLATFISPNGGLLVFWAFGFSCAWFMLRALRLRIPLIALLISANLVIFSVLGFSLWWAPFGWDSWGDRLIVPSMLASLITLICSAQYVPAALTTENKSFISLRDWTAAIQIIGMLLVVWSLHYTWVSYFSNRGLLVVKSLNGGPQCQKMLKLMRQNPTGQGLSLWRSDHYYNCASERFRHFPQLIK